MEAEEATPPRGGDGVLPVDKPEGPTSHDVVAAARRALRNRRIGHSGTLDPFASGLLLLFTGRATRLVEYFAPLPKRYRAVARLGVRTDTDDLTGAVAAESGLWRTLAPAEIRAAFQRLLGPIEQRPPAYSAKKIEGERLYERARRGEPVEARPVPVVVHRLEVLRVEPPEVEFDVECSTGTYIRSLARDAGETLGCGAHLSALRRTGIGPYRVEDALPLDRLGEADAVAAARVAPLAALAHLPRVEVGEEEAALLRNGVAVARAGLPTDGGPLAIARGDQLIAIGEAVDDALRPRKVFL